MSKLWLPNRGNPSIADRATGPSNARYPSLWHGLVGAWCPSVTGPTGWTLFDLSGNANHGTLTNMEPATDWVVEGGKYANDIDATNDIIRVGAAIDAAPTRPVFACAWIKPTNTTTRIRSFFVSSTGSNPRFYIDLNGGTSSEMRLYSGGYATASSAFTLSVSWAHYAWLWDSDDSVTYYRNGAIIGTTTKAPAGGGTVRNDIGGINDIGSSFQLDGQFDDFMLFNRVLTPSEIWLLSGFGGHQEVGRGIAYDKISSKIFHIRFDIDTHDSNDSDGGAITMPSLSSSIPTLSNRATNKSNARYPSLHDGLVGAWCPSVSGPTVDLQDLATGVHDATRNGDASITTNNGKWCADLDGVGDYYEKTGFPFLDAPYTLSAWIRVGPDIPANWYRSIISRGSVFENDSNFAFGVRTFSASNNNLFLYWKNGAAYTGGIEITNALLESDGWVHIAVTVDSSYDIEAFINGNSIGTDSGNSAAGDGSQPLRIGAPNTIASTDIPWLGQIDDVLIYNRVLNVKETWILSGFGGNAKIGRGIAYERKKSSIFIMPSRNEFDEGSNTIIQTPTYQPTITERATNKSNAKYPSLQEGLVGAWCPSVTGPTGSSNVPDLARSTSVGSIAGDTNYQLTDGKWAWYLDGTDDYVSVGKNEIIRPTGAMSISMWVKAPDYSLGKRMLSNSQGSYGSYAFEIYADSNAGGWDKWKRIAFYVTYGNPAWPTTRWSAAVLTNGEWEHIGCVFEPNVNLHTYVRGKLSNGTGGGAIPSQYHHTNPTNIGAGGATGGGSAPKWIGHIDDVRIYNRVLSADEMWILSGFGGNQYAGRGIAYEKKKTSRIFVSAEIVEAEEEVETESVSSFSLLNHNPPSLSNRVTNKSVAKYPSLQEGLVGAWCPSIQKPSGLVLNDLSINQNHGTLTNMEGEITFAVSDGKYCLTIQGDDYIEIGDHDVLDFGTGNFAISMWFTRASDATTNLRLLSKGAETNAADEAGFAFWGSNTDIAFAVNPSGTRTILSGTISVGPWYHVVGNVRRSGDQELYINGILVDNVSAPSGSVSGTDTLRIGRSSASGLYWTGLVDELLLYNRFLTPNEIWILSGFGGNNRIGRGIAFEKKKSSIFVMPSVTLEDSPVPDPVEASAIRLPSRKPIIADRATNSSTAKYPSLQQGLVGAWCPSVSGHTGDTVFDLSGNAVNRSLVNNAKFDINHGYIVNFDGVSDYVGTITDSLYNGNNPWSMAAWAYPRETSTFQNEAVIGGGKQFWIIGLRLYHIMGAGSGTISALRGADAASWTIPISYQNRWVHLAATYDGATLFLYVDGKEEASIASSASYSPNGSTTFIAVQQPIGSGDFDGDADDWRFYNRSLIPSEIYTLSGFGGNPEVGRGIAYEKKTTSVYIPFEIEDEEVAADEAVQEVITRTRPVVFPTLTNRATNKSDAEYSKLQEGLIGAWCPSVSRPTGRNIIDMSRMENHAAIAGTYDTSTWIVANGKYAWNGQNASRADLGTNSILYPNGAVPISVTAWFRQDGNGSFSPISNNGNAGRRGWHLSIGQVFTHTHNMFWQISENGTATSAVSTSNFSINDFEWMFAAGVYDPANLSVTLYVYADNGFSEIVSGAASSTQFNSNVIGNAKIGSRGQFDDNFNGLLDDIRMYNRPLTFDDVWILSGFGGNPNIGRGIGYKKKSTLLPAKVTAPAVESAKAHIIKLSSRKPTLANRATNASNAKYPSLWKGCVGAWSASVSGPTGTTLFDLNGSNNHGTLTSMDGTDVVVNGGKYATHHVSPKWISINGVPGSSKRTFSFWIYPTYFGVGFGNNIFNLENVSNDNAIYHSIGTTTTLGYKEGAWASGWEVYGGVLSLNNWQHVCIVRDNLDVTFYINMVKSVAIRNTGDPGFASGAPTTTTLGIASNSVSRGTFNGSIDDIRIYDRVLTYSEIYTLSGFGGHHEIGRGIAYQKRSPEGSYSQQLELEMQNRLLLAILQQNHYAGGRHSFGYMGL